MKAWTWFVLVQLIMLLATVVGWIVLIPFCLAQAWKPSFRLATLRDTDAWRWSALNRVYGNLEDGVSGIHALIWNNSGQQVPYMPGAWAPWRAYCWSALRNSCDNLKYAFAWEQGPLIERSILGRNVKLGWQKENGFNVPVLSI